MMEQVIDLITKNIYLSICILLVIAIFLTVLIIVITNNKKRKQIKETFEEVDKIEQEVENGKIPDELENIIQKMQENIDVKPEDVVRKFEEEQEEKAIISYQELVENVKSGKIEVIEDDNSDINYVESLIGVDEKEEPIMSVEEESKVTPEMVKDAITTISNQSIKEEKVETKKFKQSEFISPVFGIMNNKLEYPTVKKQKNILDIMSTKDYNELTEEIKRQEEFLNALKEFRNNL